MNDDTLSRRAPEQRRTNVIDAARELFIQRGQAGTSIDEIARRAGVAKGTVYLYFPSKQHIAQAIEAQFNARILRRLQEAAHDAAAKGYPPVAAWCAELVHAYLDELDTHDMLFYGHVSARDAETDTTLLDDLAALLAAHFDPSPIRTAAFLIGGTTSLVDRAILDRDTDARESLAQKARQLAGAVADVSALHDAQRQRHPSPDRVAN